MTVVEWKTTGRSFRYNGYRIDPAEAETGGWIVHIDDPDELGYGTIESHRFSSLKSAKAAALHHRMSSIRQTKLIRHSALVAVGLVALVPGFAFLAPEVSHTWPAFIWVSAVLLLTIREGVGLVMIVFSQGWDYGYDMPRVTRVDRLVVRSFGTLGHASLPREAEIETAVHVVPIDPDDSPW